jgi:recombination protein RecA
MSTERALGGVPAAAHGAFSGAPGTGDGGGGFAELAGRLVELSGWRSGACYTAALALVLDAQRAGETAVWVGPRARSFYPPDADAAGVDLAALPVVRVADERSIPFAADVLARSGAFGLVVLDLGSTSLSLGVLSRLAGLARARSAAIVCLTEKPPERPSLGSVVSFRADASFARARGEEDSCSSSSRFLLRLAVSRDRARAAGWQRVELRRGPPGLP